MSDRDERLLDVLERWYEARESGRPLGVEELVADCPDLADEVRRQIAMNDGLERAAADEQSLDTGPAEPPPTGHWAGVPVPPRPDEPPEVAGYAGLTWLAGGGMGAVYLGRDVALDRPVALKVVRAEALTPAMMARLRAEARAVAALDHPHIVKVYEVGDCVADGATVPYLALEYVQGGSLEERLGDAAMEPVEAARLVRLLAGAVAHAHERGVVHRDLKPANVLLAPPAEVAALNSSLGWPKVSDFGLALQGQVDARLTETGVTVGTPAYMAPEQAAGRTDIGPAADVWALGVIFYRLLTGRLPFQAKTRVETLYRVMHEPAVPPSRLRAGVPEGLEAVCLRCLEKDATRRPAAARLAAELDRWLAGNEVRSEPPLSTKSKGEAPGRRKRWRYPIALTVGVLLAGIGVATAAALAMGRLAWLTGRPEVAFKGYIDAEMTRPGNALRQAVRLSDPAARPLRAGDEVRVEAKLNRRGYAYVLWIDTKGEVGPVYPWLEGDWSRRGEEKPVAHLRLPRDGEAWGWWPISPGDAGLETLVLLVRETPLPAGVDLKAELIGLGAQKVPDAEGLSIAWFENGEVVRDEPERAADLSKLTKGSNPLERVNNEVQRRIAKHFAYTRSVTFGNLGGEKRRGE